jgi:pyruvate dehydrogenase E1 component alpha subunit
MTYRITGHSRRDPCNYQPEEERKEALKKEPLRRFTEYLLTGGFIDEAGLEGIRAEVNAEIERAVESAMAAPDPEPEAALEDVFV